MIVIPVGIMDGAKSIPFCISVTGVDGLATGCAGGWGSGCGTVISIKLANAGGSACGWSSGMRTIVSRRAASKTRMAPIHRLLRVCMIPMDSKVASSNMASLLKAISAALAGKMEAF
jgi:hypothetical protein